MAKKQYLIPAWLVKKLPALRRISWPVEAAVVRSLVWLMRLMAPERAARFANAVFRNLKPLLPVATKISRNLAVAFPEKDREEIERITRNACGNLGNVAAELVLAERIWAERDERVEFVMEDGIDVADFRGRPAVMVTGHIGAWQLGSFIVPQYGVRMTSIYAPEQNPYLRNFLVRLLSMLPCQFIPRDGCMRGLMHELRQGHILGLASDTRLDSGDAVPFFGVPAPTNTTAARLAIRHNCDFIPVHIERLPGTRFRITIYRAIRPSNPDAPVTEQAREMTGKLCEHFEAWIRDTPDQWMCFGRRWPQEAYREIH